MDLDDDELRETLKLHNRRGGYKMEYKMEINKDTVLGIIRHVDDLGRIVIPKEIRKSLGILEGSPLEIISLKNGIFLRKVENND